MPGGQPVGGLSQAEWSRVWWQWAASFEPGESPVADLTGEKCGNGQSGDVWFLAGTFGTRRTTRTCRVPRGKFLFFPLINYVTAPTEGPGMPCAEARRLVDVMTREPDVLVLDVDDVRVPDLLFRRQVTEECFDLGSRRQPPVRVYPAAAAGFYAMLRPLPPGRHVINLGGRLPGMAQAVTYVLIIE